LRQAAGSQSKGSASWPLAVDGNLSSLSLDTALATFRQVSSGTDVAVVEGLSGLDAPVGDASRRLADGLDARVVVVIGYTPDLGVEEAQEAKQVFGDRLAGVVINGVTKYKTREVKTHLSQNIESEGVKVLAVIPEDRRLLGVTVGQIAHHLNGRFLNWEEKKDNFVEHYLIGGMVLDWGVLYFERFENKAVIVRGNRPDVQMATLRTPTSCIVLTGGHPPIQYVDYEADQEEVPLIQVETDTLTTAAALESLQEKSLFDHPIKHARFLELMSQHGDLAAISQSLGV